MNPDTCSPICGDGLIVGSETCDDEDKKNSDGCDSTCQEETGWTCTGTPSVCTEDCGDGALVGNETCDDQQAIPSNGDGCSSSC